MTVLLKGKLYPFSSFYIKAGEGGTPTTSVVEYYTEGTIPFIKIEDLSCKYLTNNKDFITELGMQKSSAWLIPSKSVIYSNGATIGAISINEYPVCTKQGMIFLLVCIFELEYERKQKISANTQTTFIRSSVTYTVE